VSGPTNDFAVARLNADGSLDAGFNGTGTQLVAFNLGGNNNDGARAVALQPDGRIVLAGYAERQAPNYDFAVVRLNANGTLDPAFNGTGRQTVAFDVGGGRDDEANSVVVQPGGKLLVAGFAQQGPTDYDFAVARLGASGAIDTSFNGTGKQVVGFHLGGPTLSQDEAAAAAVQPDGKVVLAGLAQTSLTGYDFAAARLDLANSKWFAVGGAPGRVDLYTTAGRLVASFAPYGPSYPGGVSVALADVNGDGVDDLITGAQVGNPHVKVYSGAAFLNGTFNPAIPDASLLASFFPYAVQYNVGTDVAAADVSGNGYADIITGASVGNPDVRVFSGLDIATGHFDPAGHSLLAQFFPYALAYNVGANVAAGDTNGDGFADVVTGASAGNPDVRVYNGRDIATGAFSPTGSLLAQFFPYALAFNVGAFVSVGDVNGDGFGDVITGASAGNPQVKVYNGRAIAAGGFNAFNADQNLVTQFFAYNLGQNMGVAVGAADFEKDGKLDIITGPAHGGTPNYRVVSGAATGMHPPAVKGLDATAADLTGGIWVTA
jgi:uncharacterized delta-60 repeat protein